ncbi:hypothetical protein BH09MYX1_BH09MYX1_25230 [soil metagenome]
MQAIRVGGGVALLGILTALGVGCSSSEVSPPSPLEPLDPSGLVYETSVYLSGLEETVRVVKSPRDVIVIRADGTQASLVSITAREIAARWIRWGNFSEEFARFIASQPSDQSIPISVRYAISEEVWKEANLHIARSEYDAAQALLRSEVQRARPEASLHLASLGFKQTGGASLLPILAGKMLVRDVRTLMHDRAFTFVALDAGEYVADAPPNTQEVSGIYDTFNTAGFYASGIRIGMVEQGTCRLYDAHEAFSQVSGGGIAYQQDPSLSCTADADCAIPCGGSSSLCVAGQCVAYHATSVASVIASTRGGTRYGAAGAKLYFANLGGAFYNPDNEPAGNFQSAACSANGIARAYDWFSDPGNAVHIVNESYHCRGGFAGYWDGRAADFSGDEFARTADIFITKSAGNQGSDPNEEACPYSLNKLCVGGVNSKHEMSCFSNWVNPGGYLGGPNRTDREEPDLVAFAGSSTNGWDHASSGYCGQPPEGVETARLQSTSSWWDRTDVGTAINGDLAPRSAGTSYAAPAVASLAAFLRSNCTNGFSLDHRQLRAILMASAFVANPEGGANWRYSTPGKQNDARDGAGFADAASALAVCNQTGGTDPRLHAIHGSGTIDTTKGDDPPPGPCLFGCDPLGPPPSGQGQRILNVGTIPSSATRSVQELYAVRLDAGSRIRFVFSWDACATDRESSGTFRKGLPKVKPDFDLFLYNRSAAQYVYTSQSNDDNNEGFDVVIPSGYDGDYRVLVGWPKGASACSGFQEGYAWATAWWSP